MEHYTRSQESATAWCPRCWRMTQHRIDHPPDGVKGGGRLGPCIDPAHPQPKPKPAKAKSSQGSLFE